MPANMTTIDKERMLRTPEYGYAHVWELQQLQGDDTVKTVDVLPYNPSTGHTHISHDHKYESPQFLRIDSTIGRNRPGGFYPDFDLDTQIGHVECEAHAHAHTHIRAAPVAGCQNQSQHQHQHTEATDEQRYTN